MFVIITGNIIDGVGFIGPFINSEDAISYAERYFGNDLDWNVAELHLPDDFSLTDFTQAF